MMKLIIKKNNLFGEYKLYINLYFSLLLLLLFIPGCSSSPKQLQVLHPSKYLGNTYITKKPLLYELNLPRFDEVSAFIRDNSSNIVDKKADRRIEGLGNTCGGCLSGERLVTPVRLSYIPIGTKMTVIDEYLYDTDSSFNSPIHMLIVEDGVSNISEISLLGFKLDVEQGRFYKNIYNEKLVTYKNVKKFEHDGKLIIDYCPDNYIQPCNDPTKFFNDFKLQEDVQLEFKIDACKRANHPNNSNHPKRLKECNNGYTIEFKTLDSYLTARYYFQSWGLYGDWNNEGYFKQTR